LTSPSLLSELEVKYPFSPTSRNVLGKIPFDEVLSSKEVLQQTEVRLLASLGKLAYERHLSQLVEFASFFTAAFVASQDTLLASKFSGKEALKARAYFVKEGKDFKVYLMRLCFDIKLQSDAGGFSIPFEHYLDRICRFNIIRLQRWKLGRQNLLSGIIYLDENKVVDLFTDCAKSLIMEGITNLRKGGFPSQLEELKKKILSIIPRKERLTTSKYLYIEELLKHPVTDGRHRLVWLVLAPYLVNIKKIDDNQAVEVIRNYVSVAGESSNMKRFVEYNVKRARRNGLLPPTLSTLRNEHPDLYSLLPPEVKDIGT
jgi:hypothetical protein